MKTTTTIQQNSKRDSTKSKEFVSGSKIHTLKDVQENDKTNNGLTYDELTILLDESMNKCYELRDEKVNIQAEKNTIEKYLNKAIEENDKLKMEIRKYEPLIEESTTKKFNEYRGFLSESENRIKEIEKKKLEELEKKYGEIYKSRYGNRFN